MQTQTVVIGAFKVTLALDDDQQLSVYAASTDGSKAIDVTDEMGGQDEVCLRVSTEKIEAAAA